MNLLDLTLVLVVHFIADFMLQSDWMATGKSKWWGLNYKMVTHVSIYTAVMCVFGWEFALVNGALHWLTDAITSNATSYLWKKEKRHAFFTVIGFDQLVHALCLVWTWGAFHETL